MGSVNVSSSDAKGFVGYLLPHPSPPPLLHQKHFFALHSLHFNISTHACFKHTCSHHQNGGGGAVWIPSSGKSLQSQCEFTVPGSEETNIYGWFPPPIICHRSVSLQSNSRTSKGRNPRLSIKRLKDNREFCSFPVMTHEDKKNPIKKQALFNHRPEPYPIVHCSQSEYGLSAC